MFRASFSARFGELRVPLSQRLFALRQMCAGVARFDVGGAGGLARFGELMRNDGRWGTDQVIPKAAVDDIRKGGDVFNATEHFLTTRDRKSVV